MKSNYANFLASKTASSQTAGFEPGRVHKSLFPFQADIVRWAVRKGRCAIFADTGLGKTRMQIEWARMVQAHTGRPVLILAPLAVAQQTVREALDIGVEVTYARHQDSAGPITITNYEMLSHFDPTAFAGVVLDESSILKHHNGKTRTFIQQAFSDTPYRLACTATPAPNDHMELGTHAEFLGVMRRVDMLSRFFYHDGTETQKWHIKGHAKKPFWQWMCSWSVSVRKPSDLGYEDGAFQLLPLVHRQITVETDPTPGALFPMEAQTLQERQAARRETIEVRSEVCAELVANSSEQWIIWCNLNREAETACKLICDAVNVQGSDSLETKEQRLLAFSSGKIRVMVTKPSIAGFGMNWQHCRNVIFLGLSDSWEQYYQAIRRVWRFGQTRQVNVFTITADTEGAVVKNIERKELEAAKLSLGMVEHMADLTRTELTEPKSKTVTYSEHHESSDKWEAYHGDSVEIVASLESESIGYSVFSPPFSTLFAFSDSPRDISNTTGDVQFFEHMGYLIKELYRVTEPGRLCSFHCSNLTCGKARDGFIGLRDTRGDLIREFMKAGWIFHSEVCIWKDPVQAMQRTKAIGLLHKQLTKDSALSRQGLPDYLVTMRKPGENAKPIQGTLVEKYAEINQDAAPIVERLGSRHQRPDKRMSINLWQHYASPVWMDIRHSHTLTKEGAREEKDERHICPLQLDVIERALILWSNPDDLVLSPFMGIGSEGYVALHMARRFVGVELKESYFKQAVLNLRAASDNQQARLF